MFRLDGKTALVTGASGGIGRAIAAALHAQGATVVLSGTREAVLQEQVAELGGERAFYVTANLSDAAEADALVGKAEEAAGAPLDILINNAGLTRDTLALRMKDQDWDQVLNVDLSSPFRLCRAALKGMLRRRAGRIVNIASVVGTTGNAGQANYAAAKRNGRHEQISGAGSRFPRRDGQRRRPRLYCDTHDRCSAGRTERETDQRHSAWPPWQTGRCRLGRSVSVFGRSRVGYRLNAAC